MKKKDPLEKWVRLPCPNLKCNGERHGESSPIWIDGTIMCTYYKSIHPPKSGWSQGSWKDVLERLLRYRAHHNMCRINTAESWESFGCSCGLDTLLSEARVLLDTVPVDEIIDSIENCSVSGEKL